MKRRYATARLSKWSEFCSSVRKQCKSSLGKTGKKWIFRGHVPKQSLESSLDRAIRFYPDEDKKRGEVEKRLLREFKRRYHQYSSDAPKDGDYLEWFSIMQHYGAPTRLLDFTYSVYVAAYFALEKNIKGPYEVFAVDARWAIRESVKNNNCADTQDFFSKLVNNTDQDLNNFERFFIHNSSIDFVCPFNPFRLTERISLQSGIFMCPGNVRNNFEKNLKSLREWHKKENIVRFILDFDELEVSKAREHLYDLNITRATLFPGLGGFAESLKVYPPKMLVENDALQSNWLSNGQ